MTGRLAFTGCLGLLIAGCATQPTPSIQRSASSSPTTSTRVASAPAPQPATNPPDEVVKQDYAPHQWPAPSDDLWSRVRAGFALDGNTDRLAVRQWTQFYVTHRKHLDASLQRARPFLWHVVEDVQQRGLPMELALLPIVESGYDASARSYVGASGLWQFMPGTADHMGLERDWWYDGRNDAIASTDAALNYLEWLHDRYDDWLLALAAYNAGPGRVDAALARARSEGVEPDYWHLELPRETVNYVPKLLAVRRLMMTPARFGLDWPTLDNTPHTEVVTLPQQTEIAVAANMLDMSEDRLRRLNPGMRRWASAPNGDAELLVPSDKAAAFRTRLASADASQLVHRRTHTVRAGDVLGRIAQHYGVSVAALRQANGLHGDRIRIGEKLTIPRPGVPEREPSAEPTQTYVVQAGDNLWDIAARYNTDVAALQRANPGRSSSLHPGDKLTIPGSATPPAPTTYVVQRGDSLWSIAHDNDIAVADLRRWNRLGADTALQPGRELAIDGPAPLPDYYEVESGDSLWSIANRFSMQVATLRSLNDISSSSSIRPGQRLRLQPSTSS